MTRCRPTMLFFWFAAVTVVMAADTTSAILTFYWKGAATANASYARARHLTDQVSSPTAPSGDCTTGYICNQGVCEATCPSGFSYNHEGYWANYRSASSEPLESLANSCAARCNSDTNCVAIHFRSSTNSNCYLYSDPIGVPRTSSASIACLKATSTPTDVSASTSTKCGNLPTQDDNSSEPPLVSFDTFSMEQADETAAPDVFFSTTKVKVTAEVARGISPQKQSEIVRVQTAKFLRIPTANVKIALVLTGKRVVIHITIRGLVNCGLGVPSDPTDCFTINKRQFDELLTKRGVFSSIRHISIKTIKNEGIFISYEYYALIAAVFVVFALAVRFSFHYSNPGDTTSVYTFNLKEERQRGLYLRPLLLVGVVFYVFLMIFKEWKKIEYNNHLCDEAAKKCNDIGTEREACNFKENKCPSNGYVFLLELSLVPFLTLMLILYLYPKWGYRLAKDGAREDKHVVMPLRSCMIRNNILAPDVFSSMNESGNEKHLKIMFIPFYLFLSFFVVLVSFCCLYYFEYPSKYAAWYPYKLLWELGAVTVFGFIAKGLATKHFSIIYVLSFVVFCLDVFLGWKAYEACADMAGPVWQFQAIMRVLNVVFGAGVLNFLLGPLSVTTVLFLFSVYFYEPFIRHKSLRCVWLKTLQDWDELVAALQTTGKGASVQVGPVREMANEEWEIDKFTTRKGATIEIPFREELMDTTWDQLQAKQLEVVQATKDQSEPVCAHLRRKGIAMPWSLILKAVDAVLSVNKQYPIRPGPENDSEDDDSDGPWLENDSEDDAVGEISAPVRNKSYTQMMITTGFTDRRGVELEEGQSVTLEENGEELKGIVLKMEDTKVILQISRHGHETIKKMTKSDIKKFKLEVFDEEDSLLEDTGGSACNIQ